MEDSLSIQIGKKLDKKIQSPLYWNRDIYFDNGPMTIYRTLLNVVLYLRKYE